MGKPYIVGICGGSCSGKSTLANELKAVFNQNDSYKLPHKPLGCGKHLTSRYHYYRRNFRLLFSGTP